METESSFLSLLMQLLLIQLISTLVALWLHRTKSHKIAQLKGRSLKASIKD